jgi:thiol-disulfide isomerase/thioredoxin
MTEILLSLLVALSPQTWEKQAETAPAFALKTIIGQTSSLSDYKGKVVLLNFWASWCAPCLAEMPELDRLQSLYQSRGLQVIGIAYPDDDPHAIDRVARKLAIQYPLLLGSMETIKSYEVSDVLPVTVIIDQHGNIRDRILGILEPEEFAGKVIPLLEKSATVSKELNEPFQPAPEFRLPDLNGRLFNSTDLKGSVVVIDFWATWCGPCLSEVPTFNNLHQKFGSRGVIVIGIAIQSGWAEDIAPYRDKFRIGYPILVGEDEIVEKYGVIGFPTTYIIDRDFKVHRKYTGKLPEKSELEREIESLLSLERSKR